MGRWINDSFGRDGAAKAPLRRMPFYKNGIADPLEFLANRSTSPPAQESFRVRAPAWLAYFALLYFSHRATYY
ncbi:MAG: hypothetical protein EPN70_05540 [Paraburkholderia sp.]|uniref:hypothetical protein n=1 Tax=Paraburkholderia sp. TaxID=1926495 RepID=UPI0011F5BC89|nr:hypothetical protein [Paraburkholderia sp.]TAM06490.1 MAG: hypothetical protein EPN70_05540 [Paraburkholderia sp.]TAM29088.1 MAG: hypothetical protein EPN59_13390 [Paraburkholderia sp.]